MKTDSSSNHVYNVDKHILRSENAGSVKQGFSKIAMEMEIAKGIAFLKRKNITAVSISFREYFVICSVLAG